MSQLVSAMSHCCHVQVILFGSPEHVHAVRDVIRMLCEQDHYVIHHGINRMYTHAG